MIILPHHSHEPHIQPSTILFPQCVVIGDVTIGGHCSVWFNATIRGDVHWIKIGNWTNVQDGAILHVTDNLYPLTLGDEVTIGHGAILHGCTIGNRVLIGMGAVILDDAKIGDDCVIGAGSLVLQGMEIPPRSLVAGVPAKVKRPLRDEEVDNLPRHARHYYDLAQTYGLPAWGER